MSDLLQGNTRSGSGLLMDIAIFVTAILFCVTLWFLALSPLIEVIRPEPGIRFIPQNPALMSTPVAKIPSRPVPLKPDEEPIPPVNPNEILCDCLEFIEEVAEGERVHGTLCRCDHPDEGILWMFEGSAEGLRRLYEYLQEGVENYYDELQRKRWKR